MGIYIGIFGKKEDVLQEFTETFYDDRKDEVLEDWDNCNILFAWYGNGSYDGSAFVLFERKGLLYEVHGGHCSCYGLEGQWQPEETSVEALEFQMREGGLGNDTYTDGGVFADQLRGVLRSWKLIEFVQYGELVH